MTITHRFGRKLSLPSTVQILHELMVFSAQEDARLKREADAGVSKTLHPEASAASISKTDLAAAIP